MERYYRGLCFSKGYFDNISLNDILKEHLYQWDLIFLIGYQKNRFLKSRINVLGEIYFKIQVINLEDTLPCSKFLKQLKQNVFITAVHRILVFVIRMNMKVRT